MRKLILAFDEPSDGWLRIELGSEGHCSPNRSRISIRRSGNCAARYVAWWQDMRGGALSCWSRPELVLAMTPLDGRTARIGVRLFKDRSRTSDGDLVFEFVGERHEIVLASWR